MQVPKSKDFSTYKDTNAERGSYSLFSRKVQPGKEFIFRLKNGIEVGKAASLQEFIEKIKTVPIESLDFHTKGKHFGPWLRDLRFGVLADSIDDLASTGEKLRHDLINLFNMLR